MSFFKREKKVAPEAREYEGLVKRVGLLESYDVGADHYVMLLEGVEEPIHLTARRNVAFALTGPGDFVRFKLVDLQFDSPARYLDSFQNFTLGLTR
jgi:hypothetical protein